MDRKIYGITWPAKDNVSHDVGTVDRKYSFFLVIFNHWNINLG
ncbi:hypothetical protein ABTW24_08585 [Sphingobacterium thalpophilum]|uniref:Uncharacterized protein n=1 Tax=Sphingobacterium thalpophilum TaxID=259 RepID=A0ABV4HAZ3_9SPHI|nr:hypothetical protein [Sphingobacterium sp. N143]